MAKEEEKNPTIGRFIDPLTDMGFKILFGTEPNKELLVSFLNELFKGRKNIVDLVYNNNEKRGPQKDYRNSFYDLVCTNQDGNQFILEMQLVKQDYFKDRAVYYTSSLIHEQGPKGDSTWDFLLNEVWLIGLMDFSFENSIPDNYLHRVHLTDEETGKVFYEKLGYVFIELPNFNKTEDELETDLDGWLYVLKNLGRLNKIPVFLRKSIFQKIFKIAEVSRLSKEDYMLYEKSLMAKWNEYANYTTAKEEGKAEGKVEGKAEGKEEVVKNLLLHTDFTINKIASLANVTLAFVKKVKKDHIK